MLTNRIIPVLFLLDGRIVRSERCSEFKPIGNPLDELARFSEWEVDEIVYVNISRNGWAPDTELLRTIGERATMPLTYGGNITTLERAAWAIQNGADKVLIGRGAKLPGLIESIASKFGSQALVVSIDDADISAARTAVARGAGEILLHATERDGTGIGYDCDTIRLASRVLNVPVVACGGAGVVGHFRDALLAGADAVAAGNWFHFQEHAYKRAKQYLRKQGFRVRYDYDCAA